MSEMLNLIEEAQWEYKRLKQFYEDVQHSTAKAAIENITPFGSYHYRGGEMSLYLISEAYYAELRRQEQAGTDAGHNRGPGRTQRPVFKAQRHRRNLPYNGGRISRRNSLSSRGIRRTTPTRRG